MILWDNTIIITILKILKIETQILKIEERFSNNQRLTLNKL